MKKILLPIIILFGLIFAVYLYNLNKSTTPSSAPATTTVLETQNPIPVVTEKPGNTAAAVPLPTGQDIIRTFFNLIGEKRIPEAISMLDLSAVPDDSAKQAWGVQFNSISQIIVKSIDAYNQTEWTGAAQEYKVVLTMKMNPDSASAPIPYYGYDNGDNTRWVTIQKNSEGIWKIVGIATGP